MEGETIPRSRRSLFDRFFAYTDRRFPGDRFVLLTVIVVLVIALISALIATSVSFGESQPARGGTFTEGILGTPRFVNPVLAITQADHDLSALIYSGVLRVQEDGTLAPDLAESITTSDDGLVYNIVLRDDVYFHDGEKLNADDITFTISLVQSPELKSSLRSSWNGVTTEIISDRELNIILTEAYTPFEENLTLGILPKHVWEKLSMDELPFSQFNLEPVGSGMFQVDKIDRNSAGLVDRYRLTAANDTPNIEEVVVRFYQNQDTLVQAFTSGEITATASLDPRAVRSIADSTKTTIATEATQRVFAVFINPNRSDALRDDAARAALQQSIDRTALLEEVLAGYGEPINSALPATTLEVADIADDVRATLEDGGWTQSANGHWVKEIDETEVELAISIATANSPLFENTANYLQRVWGDLGVVVDIALYEQTDLVQSVIRPRDYQALLFGIDIGRSHDLYPFWHSSQRSDPGLNVAQYANISTDSLLAKSRTEADTEARAALIAEANAEITAENPAVFLFSPSFTYVVQPGVSVIPVTHKNRISERFATIAQWHIREESLWPIF